MESGPCHSGRSLPAAWRAYVGYRYPVGRLKILNDSRGYGELIQGPVHLGPVLCTLQRPASIMIFQCLMFDQHVTESSAKP